jgi:hypothetical protein
VENSTVDEPDGIFDNVEVNTVAEGNDTHGHPSQESVVIVEVENSAIDGLGIIHDSSKTIDTNVEQVESIVGFVGDCDDVLQKELPVQSVHESEEINTVDKANDVNGDPNKDSDHTNVAENIVDHLRPTTEMYWYNYVNSYMTGQKCTGTIMYVLLHFPPKMYWYTLGQTVVALAHRYCQTTNNVDRELTKLP